MCKHFVSVNLMIPNPKIASPSMCLILSIHYSLFQIAAKLSQLGMFMPTMLANPPAGAAAVQAQSQFAGITNPDQRAARQTAGTSASGAQPLQGLPCSGSQLNVNNPPAGLERAVPKTPTVRSADRPKLRPTQRNLA